jgi:uncharacterized protein YceK
MQFLYSMLFLLALLTSLGGCISISRHESSQPAEPSYYSSGPSASGYSSEPGYSSSRHYPYNSPSTY